MAAILLLLLKPFQNLFSLRYLHPARMHFALVIATEPVWPLLLEVLLLIPITGLQVLGILLPADQVRVFQTYVPTYMKLR